MLTLPLIYISHLYLKNLFAFIYITVNIEPKRKKKEKKIKGEVKHERWGSNRIQRTVLSLFSSYHFKLDIYVTMNFLRMFLNSIMLILCLLLDSEINKRFILYTFMSLAWAKLTQPNFYPS